MDQAKLLELVELAYAAVEDPPLWEPLLSSLSAAVHGAGASIIFHDMVENGAVMMIAGVDPEAMRLYNEHYHRVDPWALGQQALWVSERGRALPDQNILPRRELEKTEFYPFVRRYGLARMMHATLHRASGAVGGLSVHRSHQDPPFDVSELRFVDALVPHLGRALRVSGLLKQARQEQEAAIHGLDAVPCGVLLVTGDGRVVHANRAGGEILRQGEGFRLDRSVLKGPSAKITAALHQLCADCAHTTNGSGIAAGGALSVPRPSGRADLQVLVSPVRRRDPLGIAGQPQIAALVFVSDPEQNVLPDRALLQTFYRLTTSEADVAARLAAGHSIEQITEACRYTKQTAQWYSKQVLAKTGCRSRAELVRQVSLTLASLRVKASNAEG